MTLKTTPGKPFPLGATMDAKGVNFAIYSENATAVELCLFNNETDQQETEVINITEKSGNIWHVYVPGLKPGQLYGYRIDGPYDPANGHRFNKNKLLIDPNAKAITKELKWDASLYGYEFGNEQEDLSFSTQDNVRRGRQCTSHWVILWHRVCYSSFQRSSSQNLSYQVR